MHTGPHLRQISENRFEYMRDIRPHMVMDVMGFMQRECNVMRTCTVTGEPDQPAFPAFFKYGNRFFEA